MSWGYGRKASLQNQLLRSNTLIDTTVSGTKIYKASGHINTVQIVLHDNRKTIIHKSMAVITTVFGKKALDVTEHFKSLKEVYSYICNWLEYNIWKIGGVKQMELINYTELSKVEKLNDKEFGQLVDLLFTGIESLKATRETINQVWDNIYKDIFNRSLYQDEDIVNLHEKYINLMQQLKSQLPQEQKKESIQDNNSIYLTEASEQPIQTINKEQDVPEVRNFDGLQLLITNKFKENPKFNLKNLIFKMPHTLVYKLSENRIIEDKGKYWIMQAGYIDGNYNPVNMTEYRALKILITYKVRYIKSKDEIRFINIEGIETY